MAAQHAVAAFLVEELEEEMSELRRGVSFEKYDLSPLQTENGVYVDERRGVECPGSRSGRQHPRPYAAT